MAADDALLLGGELARRARPPKRWGWIAVRRAELKMPEQLVEPTNDAVDRRVATVQLVPPRFTKLPARPRVARDERADFGEAFVDVEAIDQLVVGNDVVAFAQFVDEIPQLGCTVLHGGHRHCAVPRP